MVPGYTDSVDLERDGTSVLTNLRLTIEPGEWLLLCGPSGAQVVLTSIAGLDAPAQGSMSRFGVD